MPPAFVSAAMSGRAPASVELILPSRPLAATQARRALDALALGDDELAAEAALLVTEVVANAVEHADGGQLRVVMTVDAEGQRLFCAVFDSSAAAPIAEDRAPREAGSDAEGGRGLHLVATLSQAWGYTRADDGKWVWFRLDRGPAAADAA
ncbi:ATP-binding protein [Streptomyces pathocidini]